MKAAEGTTRWVVREILSDGEEHTFTEIYDRASRTISVTTARRKVRHFSTYDGCDESIRTRAGKETVLRQIMAQMPDVTSFTTTESRKHDRYRLVAKEQSVAAGQ